LPPPNSTRSGPSQHCWTIGRRGYPLASQKGGIRLHHLELDRHTQPGRNLYSVPKSNRSGHRCRYSWARLRGPWARTERHIQGIDRGLLQHAGLSSIIYLVDFVCDQRFSRVIFSFASAVVQGNKAPDYQA
jgi:hypothetical protein